MIEFRHAAAGYGKEIILRDVTFTAPQGKLTILLGPNGSGKTTLLKTAARQLPLKQGEICINGRSVSAYGRMEFARTAAFVPQSTIIPDITVETLVCHGRFPYLGMSRTFRQCDRDAVEAAMSQMGIERWKDRNLKSLSGGERQLAFLAMALAQDTPVLLLDEPTAFLDVQRQFQLIEKLHALAAQGKTLIAVLHDLPGALQYGDYLALLKDGCLQAAGTPEEIFESRKISNLFGVEILRDADRIYYLKKQ